MKQISPLDMQIIRLEDIANILDRYPSHAYRTEHVAEAIQLIKNLAGHIDDLEEKILHLREGEP